MGTQADSSIHVVPLGAALGAVVEAGDLARLEDGMVEAIRSAWLEHKVLFFRDQDLGPENHLRFARRFGEVERHPYVETVEGCPEVQVVHSSRGGRADVWHSDATFETRPPMAAVLRYVEGPSVGGDTMWANQCLAYERCSEPMRQMLDGLTARHTAGTFGKPEQATEHPVVRIHPETGKRSLFVNRLFTRAIPQMDPVESDALLEHLFDWSSQLELTCRWSWRPGDVVMWDNRATQHYAINDYDEPRILERVILAGEEPRGNPSTWPSRPDGWVSARTGYRLGGGRG